MALYNNTARSYAVLPEDVKRSLYEASGLEFFTYPAVESSSHLYASSYIGFSNGFSYFQFSEILEVFLWYEKE